MRALAKAQAYLAAHPYLAELYVTHHLGCNDANDAFRLAGRLARGQLKIVMRAR